MKKPIVFKKSKFRKPYEIYYDSVSERFVFHIEDFDGLFPLLLKGDQLERVYELQHTKNRKLQLR